MATRSRIGIELKDGSILSCLSPLGWLSAVVGSYSEHAIQHREQAAELIDGGDMSSCWADEIWGKKLPQGEYAPEYYSARGENCPPRYDQTREEFLSDGEEYSYVFTNAGWTAMI